MEEYNLVKNTLDKIPSPNANAKRIVGLVKEGGRITDTSYLTTPLWKNSRR